MVGVIAVMCHAATFMREGFDGKGQRLLLAELFALLASQGGIQTGLKIGASIADCRGRWRAVPLSTSKYRLSTKNQSFVFLQKVYCLDSAVNAIFCGTKSTVSKI